MRLGCQSLAIGIDVIFGGMENVALPFRKKVLQTKRPRRRHLNSYLRTLGVKNLQDPWDAGINIVMWAPQNQPPRKLDSSFD